jgi:nicotinamidase-related amidase
LRITVANRATEQDRLVTAHRFHGVHRTYVCIDHSDQHRADRPAQRRWQLGPAADANDQIGPAARQADRACELRAQGWHLDRLIDDGLPDDAAYNPSPVRTASAPLKRIQAFNSSMKAGSFIWSVLPWTT